MRAHLLRSLNSFEVSLGNLLGKPQKALKGNKRNICAISSIFLKDKRTISVLGCTFKIVWLKLQITDIRHQRS